MPAELERDQPGEPSRALGFWRRQFHLPATTPQLAFDLLLGIIAPVACLIEDPGVFHRSGLPGTTLLSHYWLFAYLEIGMSIAALAYYLLARRASAFLAGILFAGAAFAIAVGVIMFPLTLVAVFMLIGILGLTPFFTALAFLRNASRCWVRSGTRTRLSSAIVAAACGAVVTLGLALGIHLETVRIANRALVLLQSGSDVEFAQAVQALKWVKYAVDPDNIVIAYANTKDDQQRYRLSRAYQAITGERIEDRLARLND